MMFVDSHCHLHLEEFKEFIKARGAGKSEDFYTTDAIVSRASLANVNYMLNIGTHLADVDILTEISDKFPNVFRTIGVHPEHAEEHLEKFSQKEMREIFKKCCSSNKTVGIGEIGLDYHSKTSAEKQKELFHMQLEFVEEFEMPISIHSRDAWQATMDILAQHPQVIGVIHCFSGEKEFTERVLETTYYFGIGGIVTFKKNIALQNAVREIPLNRILLETDAPFLAPEPFRGQVNESSMIVNIAEKVAQIKEIPLSEVESQTTFNFFNLFSKAKVA